MKTVLVTGANGFIGKSLCSALKEKGYSVIGVSRNMTTAGNIAVNLLKPEECRKKLADLKPDVIVHLAAFTNKGQLTDGFNFQTANALMLQTVLDIFGSANPYFIFAGSTAVYGEAGRGYMIDLDDVMNPPTDYGKSKILCEKILMRSNLSNVWILRFSPVFSSGKLEDIAKRVFVPGQQILRMKILPPPAYNFCRLETAVNVIIEKIENARQCRNMAHVMDAIPFSQHEVFSWFSGPSLNLSVKYIRPLQHLSSFLPEKLRYRVICNIEKLLYTHLFSPYEKGLNEIK